MIKKTYLVACLISILIPSIASSGTIQLPQTGQNACWDANGNGIACASTGQDGDLRAGISWASPRFTDNGDQTMTDNLTGLIWAKDGNVMKTRDPGFDADGTAGNGMVTWQHALDYIKKLNRENFLGHNDWRLPNVIELKSLVNAGQDNSVTWLKTQGFINVQANFYWSSNNNTSMAWTISLRNGFVSNYVKASTVYVWPVRSGPLVSSVISLPRTGQTTCYDAEGSTIGCFGTGQDGELQMGAAWPNPRFTDNGNQTMTDNLTGMMWTKDSNAPGPAACGPGTAKNWQEALDYVKCLNQNNYLGHTDWRLPNVNELHSLVNFQESHPGIWLNSQGFANAQSNLAHWWSSSTYIDWKSNAWTVNMYYMDYINMLYNNNKTTAYYVWPARAGLVGLFYNLLILKSGTGAGSVTVDNGPIEWNGNLGRAMYSSGTPVTLTATPDAGSTFTGWSVDGCSGAGNCTVIMDGHTKATAHFPLKVKGDINNDGTVTMADAILALKVMAGMNPASIRADYLNSDIDVNGEGKIGLAEVIYILQKAAGLR